MIREQPDEMDEILSVRPMMSRKGTQASFTDGRDADDLCPKLPPIVASQEGQTSEGRPSSSLMLGWVATLEILLKVFCFCNIYRDHDTSTSICFDDI